MKKLSWKELKAEHDRKYRKENKLKFKEKSKKYYETSKKEILEYQKKYRNSHKKEISEYQKEYRRLHKKEAIEYMEKYGLTHKKEIRRNKDIYYDTHKKIIFEHDKNRRKTDINYRIKCCLIHRIYLALKGISKSTSTRKLLGCNIDFFRNYYESKFTKGMSWAKVMNGEIHCDHIRPCASFDLSKLSEQRKCFHYTNLQPLWAKENIIKSDKIYKKGVLNG